MSRAQPESRWQRLTRFMKRDLWQRDLESATGWEHVRLVALRIAYLIGRGYGQHRLTVRAAALTYITVVSIVPTLAVAFAMFNAFGGLQRAKEVLLPKILEYLAVGVRGDVTGRIDQFLQNINNGAVGGIGLLFVFLSAIFMLSSMENAFNEIWGVKRDRSFFQSVTLYWTVLTVAPTLIVIGMALSPLLHKIPLLQWGLERTGLGGVFFSVLLPLTFVWLAFCVMYGFIPNTRVSWRAAALGGIAGGGLWLAAISGYAWYASAAVSYSKIYGSLGAIPIFLLWVYVTWVIILLGAELAFAVQNFSAYGSEVQAMEASQAARELLALRIMQEVARRFLKGTGPGTSEELSVTLRAPVHLVNEVVHELVEAGLLIEVDESHELLPARDPHRVFPAELVRTLRERGQPGPWVEKDPDTRELAARRQEAEEAASLAWGPVSFADLALNSGSDGPNGHARPAPAQTAH